MKKVKAIVIRAPGTNNELETAEALSLAGAGPETVRLNEITADNGRILSSAELVVIPGGFSYGDELSAGRIFANKLVFLLGDAFRNYAKSGRPLLGICNGFQILVKAGLLPGPGGRQELALAPNDSGVFEARWCSFSSPSLSRRGPASFWTKGLPEIYRLPVAHAEGRLAGTDKVLDRLERKGQILMRYRTEDGRATDYPANPNGSARDIAAVTSAEGNVLGMMGHPERFMSKYVSPRGFSRDEGEPAGLVIFRNAVRYAASIR